MRHPWKWLLNCLGQFLAHRLFFGRIPPSGDDNWLIDYIQNRVTSFRLSRGLVRLIIDEFFVHVCVVFVIDQLGLGLAFGGLGKSYNALDAKSQITRDFKGEGCPNFSNQRLNFRDMFLQLVDIPSAVKLR